MATQCEKDLNKRNVEIELSDDDLDQAAGGTGGGGQDLRELLKH